MNRRTLTNIVAALCLCTGWAMADNEYMVEKGDSLIKIGTLLGVPYKEIMKANKMTTTTIFPDQILTIPAGGRTTDRDLAALAFAAEQKAKKVAAQPKKLPGYSDIRSQDSTPMKVAFIPPVQGASKTRPVGPAAPETYTVREGDTLWNISQKFGVEASHLGKMNNIKFSKINIGQVLTLPAKVSIAAN